MFIYSAHLLRVVDGDTVDLDVDLGFNVHLKPLRVRLKGINTPESNSKDPAERERAKAATKYLEGLVSTGKLTVQTIKDEQEKYGRYLARIVVDETNVVVNDEMIRAGHAVAYDGGKR